MKKQLTCVVCPHGCALEVEIEDGEIKSVSGNNCARGPKYAQSELFNPMRMLTTTVSVSDRANMLPVRTREAIPKDKVFAAMEDIKNISTKSPVKMGDVIKNIQNTGIDVVASTKCE